MLRGEHPATCGERGGRARRRFHPRRVPTLRQHGVPDRAGGRTPERAREEPAAALFFGGTREARIGALVAGTTRVFDRPAESTEIRILEP